MSKNLTEIAQQLKGTDKKVQLIYAFNGTGKTRLSRAFKELIVPENSAEPSRNKFRYDNAFTEDLFYWDHDLDAELKLKIQRNGFTDWILKDQGQEQNIITNFQRHTHDKLNPHFSENYTEVTFSLERGNDESSGNLKISKGEESHFIWSIFYALLAQMISVLSDSEKKQTDQFNELEYVLIDDPVSSLDENHLIELAVNLAKLISKQTHLKFIITTHNPLFYHVLHSELKPKNSYILSQLDDGSFELEEKKSASNTAFSDHLHIKNLIEQAVKQNNVQRDHFTLLRNLYEKTASFLGYKQWANLLNTAKGDQDAYLKRIIQFSSHSKLSNEEIAEPTPPEKQTIKCLLEHLQKEFRFYVEANKQEENHA